MQLLKSIFCLSGFDNRQRFGAISAIAYLGFILFSAMLNNYFIIAIILLLIFAITCLFTTRRRLQDAQLNKNWCLVPSITFVLTGFIILFVDHASSYWLLLVPIISSSLLLTYPGKANRAYRLGYNGPVDLSQFHQQNQHHTVQNNRIEPTLIDDDGRQAQAFTATMSSAQPELDHRFSQQEPSNTTASAQTTSNQTDKDIGEQIRLYLLNKKNAVFTISAVLAFIVIAIILSVLIFEKSPEVPTLDDTAYSTNEMQQQDEKLHKIDLPDNFSLLLNQYQGVIINWQSDITNLSQLWSLKSAQGDSSCQKITFNNGESYRTYAVLVETSSEYFATFSPLDTQKILQAIAFRGSFTLCGYTFSLKGSQGVIGKNNHYAQFIEY